MAKWYGVVGYVETVENQPGVWKEKATERYYYGDVVQETSRYQSANLVNDNLVLSNKLSIVADPYAIDNFSSIRYAEFMGDKWKVNSVDVRHPRLLLTLGGVYNGEQA